MTTDQAAPLSADASTPASADRPWLWLLPLAGLVLSTIASALCLYAAGPQHGVLFGACAAVVLLTPSLVAGGDRSVVVGVLVVGAVAVGALVGPAFAFAKGELNTRTFVPAAAVIPSLSLAAAGLTILLMCVRVSPSVAAWLVTLLLLAWLSWPIWLSPWLAGREWLVDLLSPAHPLLSLDAALTRENAGPWIQRPLMYSRLTVLGQHVFPRPPERVGFAVLLHVIVGLPGFVLASLQAPRSVSRK